MKRLADAVAHVASVLLRRLYLSCEAGALVHNRLILLAYQFSTYYFGPKIPDVPEVDRVIRRWRDPQTMGIIRKTYDLAPPVRRRVVETHVMWTSVVGWWRRLRQKRAGNLVPSVVFITPTYRCNLDCDGCFASNHKRGEFSASELERIVQELETLGIFQATIFGGEPFLLDYLWQLYAHHPHTLFTVFTNGTLVNERVVARLAKLGNVRLIVSLEGFKETTDRRRGKGVYKKAITALRLCQQANIYYGVSVTVSRENFDEVTSKLFIEVMNALGIHFINYVLYMPCNSGNGTLSAPTTEQVQALEEWGEYVRRHFPIIVVIGRNGSELVTFCSAAEGRIHITPEGVEPCPFCQFAAERINGRTIPEVMRSDFFQLVRTINSTGAFPTPCKTSESQLLQRLFENAGAYSTTKGE